MPHFENVQQRRTKRQKDTAEIFTPNDLVAKMLSHLPEEVWEEGKTFCDPACGNGNFLIAALWRKLDLGHDPTEALRCIYGVDIMRDNIAECRLRLLKVMSVYSDITKDHIKIVFKNICFANPKTKYKNGSLSFPFNFSGGGRSNDFCEDWLQKIADGMLNQIELPLGDADDVPSSYIDFD